MQVDGCVMVDVGFVLGFNFGGCTHRSYVSSRTLPRRQLPQNLADALVCVPPSRDNYSRGKKSLPSSVLLPVVMNPWRGVALGCPCDVTREIDTHLGASTSSPCGWCRGLSLPAWRAARRCGWEFALRQNSVELHFHTGCRDTWLVSVSPPPRTAALIPTRVNVRGRMRSAPCPS